MLLAGAFDQLNSIMSNFAEFDNSARYSAVQSFMNVVANTFIAIATGLSVAALALGFVQMATSTGDPKNAERAQRAILWGALGIILSLLAYLLKTILLSATGVSGVN